MIKQSGPRALISVSALAILRQEDWIVAHGRKVSTALQKMVQLIGEHIDEHENKQFFIELIGENIACGSASFLFALLDSNVLPSLDSSRQSCRLLNQAAAWSQIQIFQRILDIMPRFKLEDAHWTLGVIIQFPGPSQVKIVKTFIARLETEDLAIAAVNYSPTDYCHSSCQQDHVHTYYPSQFWNAIDEGNYEVAKVLAPFARENDGEQASTMFQLLSKARGDLPSHVRFLIQLGPEYCPFVSYPLAGYSVLHVAMMYFGKAI